MKVLIADDHALFRDGLSIQLEQLAPQTIVFQAGNFSQAIKIIEDEPKLDLILVDLDMPDMQWEEGLRQLQMIAGDARIVVISASEDLRSIRRVIESGISGYIPKRADTKVLTGALKLILDGGTYFPPVVFEGNVPAMKAAVTQVARGKSLTNRQSEVLGYVAEGLSNKQIAYEMGVSEATVKLHVNALLRSVGATNRTQAVIKAQKMGLI